MLFAPTDWLLLTTTALGVAGTGYGQWKLRRERQAVARKLAENEWVEWHTAQKFINEDVLRSTAFASLEELKTGYAQLVRGIGSSVRDVARQDDFSLATERLRELVTISTVIRYYQAVGLGEGMRQAIIFEAGKYGWEFPEIARRLHGLSLHQIAGLGVYMLRDDSSSIEQSLVDMGLRKSSIATGV